MAKQFAIKCNAKQLIILIIDSSVIMITNLCRKFEHHNSPQLVKAAQAVSILKFAPRFSKIKGELFSK